MERSSLVEYIFKMFIVLIVILAVSGVVNAGRKAFDTVSNGTTIVCQNAKGLSSQAVCPFNDAR